MRHVKCQACGCCVHHHAFSGDDVKCITCHILGQDCDVVLWPDQLLSLRAHAHVEAMRDAFEKYGV